MKKPVKRIGIEESDMEKVLNCFLKYYLRIKPSYCISQGEKYWIHTFEVNNIIIN